MFYKKAAQSRWSTQRTTDGRSPPSTGRYLLGKSIWNTALIATVGILGTSAAFADSSSGLYGVVGGGLGYWNMGEDSRTVALENAGGGSGTTDTTSAAFKVGLGYQFNVYNGIDLTYHNNGKFQHRLQTNAFGDVTLDVKVRRVVLGYVLTIPATQNFSVMGRVGVHRWEEKWSDGFNTVKDNDTDATFGVGAKYRLSNNASLTLEYEHFHQQENNLYLDFSETLLGLQYRF